MRFFVLALVVVGCGGSAAEVSLCGQSGPAECGEHPSCFPYSGTRVNLEEMCFEDYVPVGCWNNEVTLNFEVYVVDDKGDLWMNPDGRLPPGWRLATVDEMPQVLVNEFCSGV